MPAQSWERASPARRSPVAPLDGIRVLELCHFLAGPYTGLVLADLGADVLKVEDPSHPDDARSMGPHFQGDQSLYFVALNSGKRSIGVHLATAGGRAVVEDLVRHADVVIDNYRPGVLAKFGLGHDALHTVNPAVVTCSLTGYGETGPDARRAGYDYTIQALAGVMSLAGEPDGPPTKAGISYVDHSGGITAALGVCAALVERARTGVGSHVDVSLFDVQISMLTYLASWQRNRDANFTRTENSAHPTLVPAQNFRTADGHLALFVGNDAMWRRFADAHDDPVLAEERFATREGRLEHRLELVDRLQRSFLGATSHEWEARLGAVGVACGAVNDVAGALAEPQTLARGLLVQNEHPDYGRYEHLRGPLPIRGRATVGPGTAPRRAHARGARGDRVRRSTHRRVAVVGRDRLTSATIASGASALLGFVDHPPVRVGDPRVGKGVDRGVGEVGSSSGKRRTLCGFDAHERVPGRACDLRGHLAPVVLEALRAAPRRRTVPARGPHPHRVPGPWS